MSDLRERRAMPTRLRALRQRRTPARVRLREPAGAGRPVELRVLFPAICVAVAAALAARLATVLMTTGGNTPSGDDVWPIQRFTAPVLEGHFQWSQLLTIGYGNGQEQAVAFLIYIVGAVLTHMDFYAFAWYAVALGIVRTFLVFDLVVRSTRPHPARWVLLPLIAAATFSFGQIALFEFDVTSVPFGTTLTAILISLWALVRFSGRTRGAVIASIAAVVACFSGASGPVAWPLLLVAAALLGFRRKRDWAILGTSVVVTVGTYAALFRQAHGQVQARADTGYHLSLVQDLLGLNFGGPGWPQTRVAGTATMVVAGILLVVTIVSVARRQLPLRAVVPGYALTGFGVACVLQLVILRGFAVQYYAYGSMFIWLGFIALAWTLLMERGTGARRLLRLAPPLLGAAVLVAFGYLDAKGNTNWEQTTLFSRWRTVVTESCVRHYRIAPTSCEASLVPWAPGRIPAFTQTLSRPFEQHSLGPFAPHQTWWLQGDYLLDAVHPVETGGDAIWITDTRYFGVPFRSPRRLNLLMPSPTSMHWRVHIPKGATATFHTRANAATTIPGPQVGVTGFVASVVVVEDGRTHKGSAAWVTSRRWSKDMSVDLDRYAGRTIDVVLGSDTLGDPAADFAIFERPRIDVHLARGSRPTEHESRSEPPVRAADLTVPVDAQGAWRPNGEIRRTGSSFDGHAVWRASEGKVPVLAWRRHIDTCLGDYADIELHIAASPPWDADPEDLVNVPHAARIYFKLDGEPSFTDLHSVELPYQWTASTRVIKRTGVLTASELRGDDRMLMREYYYPIHALELPRDAHLTGLAIAPFERAMRGTVNDAAIGELRLVKRTDLRRTTCTR